MARLLPIACALACIFVATICMLLDKLSSLMLVFPELSELDRKKINSLLHLPTLRNSSSMNIRSLSIKQVEEFHNKGFTVLRGGVDFEALEAMKITVNHAMRNPNGLLRNANNTSLCGFSLHNELLIPEWRKIAYYNIPSVTNAAVDLLSAEDGEVVYAGDVLHATTPECNMNPGGQGDAHSDQNLGPWSIERKKNFGDNMVVAWIAIDPLDELITMELFEGTHDSLDKSILNNCSSGKDCVYNSEKYCQWFNDAKENKMCSISDETNRKGNTDFVPRQIHLEPGDVVFFQGLTLHRVRKSTNCTLETCRRATIRYINGDTTRWRTDIKKSVWPYTWEKMKPGELIKKDHAVLSAINGLLSAPHPAHFSTTEVILPSRLSFLNLLSHIVRSKIFQENDSSFESKIINKCPKKSFL